MSYVSNPNQQPDKAILDFYSKQNYLGNEYSLGLNALDLSSGETPVCLIKNPLGNPKALFLSKFSISASAGVIIRIYANPTVTSTGTPQTPTNLRIASTQTSSSLCYLNPSVSGSGSFLFSVGAGGSISNYQNYLQAIIDAGNSVLITADASQDSVTTNLSAIFFEV